MVDRKNVPERYSMQTHTHTCLHTCPTCTHNLTSMHMHLHPLKNCREEICRELLNVKYQNHYGLVTAVNKYIRVAVTLVGASEKTGGDMKTANDFVPQICTGQ